MTQGDLDLLVAQLGGIMVGMSPMEKGLWVIQMLREAAPEHEWVLQADANGKWDIATKERR